MEKNGKKYINIACIAVFAVLFAAYFFYHRNTQLISSDNMFMLPMLLDFLDGNILLKGWSVNTSSYIFTDTIWCLPGFLLGMPVPVVISMCAAFFHAGFTAVMLWIVLTDEYEQGRIKGPAAAAAASAAYLMLFAVVPYKGYTIENPTYMYFNLCVHAGTFLFIAFEMLILYLWRRSGYKKAVYPVVFTVYGIMGQMSDSTPLMVFFGPLMVYSLYYIIWPKVPKNRKKDIFLVCDSIFIVIGADLVKKLIMALGGLKVVGVGMGIAPADRIMLNLKTMLIKMLLLFGYDTANGIDISIGLIVACLIIGLIGLCVIYHVVLAFKGKPDSIGLLLSLGMISDVIGTVFISTNGSDGFVSSRYVMAVAFYGTALIAKTVLGLSRKAGLQVRILTAFVLIMSAGFAVNNLKDLKDIPNYRADGEAAAAYIEQKGGGVGYGAAWVAEAVSTYMDFDPMILPVWWSYEPYIYPNKLFVYPEWYDSRDIHYIVLQSDETDAYSVLGARHEFIDIAGEPDEDMVFGKYEVMYYDRDLSDLLLVTPDSFAD